MEEALMKVVAQNQVDLALLAQIQLQIEHKLYQR